MTRYLILHALCLTLIAAPVAAQQGNVQPDAGEKTGEVEKGFGLMQEGTRLMLEGLMQRVEPALRDLGSAIDDLNAYQTPEILPNGDILIRRKTPLQPEGNTPAPDAETPPGENPDENPGENIEI